MPTAAAPQEPHVKPYVQVGERTRALHFNIHEVQSRMQVADPLALDLDYTRTMMGFLLFQPAPRQLTMIGLGGGSLAKFCHRHLPRTRLRVVEINPHVIALRDTFHVPPDDDRFTVVLGDGARAVREDAEPCDVLLVDGYDSQGLPARLSSQRFYDDCQAALAPGGVMVANLHTGHRRFEVFVDRIRRSFDDEVLVVEAADLTNSVVFAFRGRRPGARRRGPLRAAAGLDTAALDSLRAELAAVAAAASRRPRPGTGLPGGTAGVA
jgi:spermidine synthase